MNARVRIVVAATLIALAVLVLIGATYQGVATAVERRRYPHPGRLVDVGGHQLHIYCIGDGFPTVVLEAPENAMSAVWGLVQPEVAKSTRVCSYDRSGLGWSEAGDKPYDPGRVPEELHALLAAAKEPGPYVLAGHSLGAAFISRFAGLYPAETAALVLIDQLPAESGVDVRFAELAPWLARTGLPRLASVVSRDRGDLPEPAAGATRAFTHRPDHLTRAGLELSRLDDALHLAQQTRLPPDLPIDRVQLEPVGGGHARDRDLRSLLLDSAAAARVSQAIVRGVTKAQRGRS